VLSEMWLQTFDDMLSAAAHKHTQHTTHPHTPHTLTHTYAHPRTPLKLCVPEPLLCTMYLHPVPLLCIMYLHPVPLLCTTFFYRLLILPGLSIVENSWYKMQMSGGDGALYFFSGLCTSCAKVWGTARTGGYQLDGTIRRITMCGGGVYIV